jgi:hypothetical protein
MTIKAVGALVGSKYLNLDELAARTPEILLGALHQQSPDTFAAGSGVDVQLGDSPSLGRDNPYLIDWGQDQGDDETDDTFQIFRDQKDATTGPYVS